MSTLNAAPVATTPTLGFWAMLKMVWGFIGRALMLGNQSIDMLAKGINAADQVVSVAEKHAIAFHESETAKLVKEHGDLLTSLGVEKTAEGYKLLPAKSGT